MRAAENNRIVTESTARRTSGFENPTVVSNSNVTPRTV